MLMITLLPNSVIAIMADLLTIVTTLFPSKEILNVEN